MTASSRGSKTAVSLMRSSRHPRVCSDCISSITRTPSQPTRRAYSAAAAAVQTSNASDSFQSTSQLPPVTASAAYTVRSGLLLSRPPLLTRSLTPFEKAFFFYQKRLNERLAMPFSRYFYFKKDTPADIDWKIKARERGGQPARELGGYNAYSDEGWNDELLVGDKLSETESMVDALVKDSEVRAVEGKDGKAMEVTGDQKDAHEGGMAERPLGLLTDADVKGDERRLDRALQQTLYLCVKNKSGKWEFPAGKLEGRENLHQAAERILIQSAGMNMNTWIIGHAPVGHYIQPALYNEDSTLKALGEKTFYMKARIMAGQANLEGNQYGLQDFKWLTKEELQKHFGLKYYSDVKNMLADR